MPDFVMLICVLCTHEISIDPETHAVVCRHYPEGKPREIYTECPFYERKAGLFQTDTAARPPGGST